MAGDSAQRRSVLVVLAGAADGTASAGGGTPLQDAETPGLDLVARRGRSGVVELGPAATPWDGFTALLGIEPGAAALGAVEALGAGIAVPAGRIAWRADFATVDDAGLRDPRAGKVKEPEAGLLLEAVRASLPGIDLHRLEGHRNLAVAAGPAEFAPSPWEMVGRRPHAALSQEGRLRAWYDAAHAALAPHDVNHVRLDLLENPANALWFHGGGAAVTSPLATALGARRVSLVGRGRVTAGLAAAAGWTAVVVDGDDEQLAGEALAALAESEVVIVRTESILWAAASGGAAAKRDAISAADARLVRPLLSALEERGPSTFAVAADSFLDATTRALLRRAVPAAVIADGGSTPPGASARFTESACVRSGSHWTSGAQFAASI